ncbi:MAG: hypothetical protein PHS86_08915 [Syntrophaceae bacterium]|nr:hypothetical protein [Syntrophaceae bacterium]
MRQLLEMFQAMSMAVAFAEEGQAGTALEIMELGRRRRSVKLQSEVKRTDNRVRKPTMRV